MGTQIIVQITSRALKDLQKVRGFNDLFYLLSLFILFPSVINRFILSK